jgi:hypothetical protein
MLDEIDMSNAIRFVNSEWGVHRLYSYYVLNHKKNKSGRIFLTLTFMEKN